MKTSKKPWVLAMLLTSILAACSSSRHLGLSEMTDPWRIQETAIENNRIRVVVSHSLLKSLTSGGDGQLLKVVHQRAEQLRVLGNYERYTITKYSESIVAGLMSSERIAEAEVVFPAKKLETLGNRLENSFGAASLSTM